MTTFNLETQEKLAMYLGYGQSLYTFQQHLSYRGDVTETIKQVVFNILDRLEDLDNKAINTIGVSDIKRIEDIEFNQSVTPETYLHYAAKQVELLSKLLNIPLVYNLYDVYSSSGCGGFTQIR